ncbi:MAG: hypothetical protein AAF485_03120 [Chloroflexota bacterium]
MSLFNILLTIHIIAGFTALIASFFATLSKSLNVAHKWHIYTGLAYFWGMVIIFLTAIPMSILNPNLFLFLIAIFSFYLAFTGWRFAKNRQGTPNLADWVATGLMLLAGVGMVLWGTYIILTVTFDGIILVVFGAIGTGMGVTDWRLFQAGGVKGKERIVAHLNKMLGGTIATLTAFIVTNFSFDPQFVLWLAPTVIVSPIIAWWSRRLMAGKRTKGMG